MKKFQPVAKWVVASLSMLTARSEAALSAESPQPADPMEPVGLRPLNLPADNLFARHSSHSSHSSHASHRSGSGGSSFYSPPAPAPSVTPRYFAPVPSSPPPSSYSPQPIYTPPPPPATEESPRYQQGDPGRPATVSPQNARIKPVSPTLSVQEKLRLQVMRVQLALLQLGIYDGDINGVLDSSTRESLRRFQIIKGFHPNGLMTTETLNALGVPAAQ